jgi:hypothetical protein
VNRKARFCRRWNQAVISVHVWCSRPIRRRARWRWGWFVSGAVPAFAVAFWLASMLLDACPWARVGLWVGLIRGGFVLMVCYGGVLAMSLAGLPPKPRPRSRRWSTSRGAP